MLEIGMLFGGLAGIVVVLVVVLLRRGNSATENADGLLIEQARRIDVQEQRAKITGYAVNGFLPWDTDRPRRP
ncbi:hypothetical protein ACH4C6_15190 [Streptomyces sp. NPDC017943]|uniref:hypothetical protein n=1 Tax=Streptomyces sp. NPDC017943 TaxID=3365019 RepID=UPI003792A280